MQLLAQTTCLKISRKRWILRGQLQGVGFRPFVYRVALELRLDGFVRNDSSHVTVEAQGPADVLDELGWRLIDEAPALAKIAEVRSEALPTVAAAGFEIHESQADADGLATVTVDTAVCGDCVRELFEASDFRFGYPLINCTNCGPRYSIIHAMPYDRANTTMSRFSLCEKCHQQYLSPADRRFHAQPVACDTCGPRVGLHLFESGECDWTAPIAKAAELIRAGKIVAVKGIGGFHLACRADDEAVVAELRRRKHRDAKPFAVMCADVEMARGLVSLGKEAERALTSPLAPVVLSKSKIKNQKSTIASLVAMGNHRLGVMVPYTPVHHLLFAELRKLGFDGALVMTSANLTDEPLVKENEEAMARLKGIADAILLHERDIERSIDDSVVIDMGEGEKVLPIRRARGYVPAVVVLSRHEGTKPPRHEEEAVHSGVATIPGTALRPDRASCFKSPGRGDIAVAHGVSHGGVQSNRPSPGRGDTSRFAVHQCRPCQGSGVLSAFSHGLRRGLLNIAPAGAEQNRMPGNMGTPVHSSIKNQKSKIENSHGLCVGGELKNTVAVVRGDEVILSHHLGDLKHTLSYEYFRKAIEDLCKLFEVRPQWIAHDLHPAYLSTQWAKELGQKWGVPLIGVQHHHAHAAAVLAEHGVTERALAIVCDGVGFGEDGTAWGGELLMVDGVAEKAEGGRMKDEGGGSEEKAEGGRMKDEGGGSGASSGMTRLAHLRAIPLAGGDAAARDTRRCAAGVMWEMGLGVEGLFEDQTEAAVVTAMLQSGRQVAKSSGAGRLFDAVAALLGVCSENTHEAQAAMALESLASSFEPQRHRGTERLKIGDRKSKIEIDLLLFVLELKTRREAGEDVSRLAWEFHEEFAQRWAEAAVQASADTGVKIVGLSGGVFCNEILTKRMTALLSAAGLTVLRHEIVPPNDGGIALGQAAVARRQ